MISLILWTFGLGTAPDWTPCWLMRLVRRLGGGGEVSHLERACQRRHSTPEQPTGGSDV